MRKFLSLIVVMMLAFNVKAQGLAIIEEADFTFSDNGTEKTLFEVLDGGQHALLFFLNYQSTTDELRTIINGVYNSFGKNQNDVYMIGIDKANESILLNQWAFDYEVEYPLVAKDQGADSISQTYGEMTGVVWTPALVLIAPNHDIILKEIWPITSADQVVGIINDNLVTGDDNTGNEGGDEPDTPGDGGDEGDDNPSTPVEPVAPTVVATTTETTITLTWNAVDGATEYNIYTPDGFDTHIYGITETTYTFEDLMPGKEYCFKVSAVYPTDESNAVEVCATTKNEGSDEGGDDNTGDEGDDEGDDPNNPGEGGDDNTGDEGDDPNNPGEGGDDNTGDEGDDEGDDNPSTPIELAVPQNLVATATETTIVLTWDAVEGATRYYIYEGTALLDEVTETTYTIENLAEGRYCYKVSALEDLGYESDAAEACATVGEEPGDGGEDPEEPGDDPEEPGDNPSDPFNPAMPTVVATTTETTITLTWEAVDGATEYNIYTPASFEANVLGITETTYTFENLITGVEYCFQVSAVSLTGESDAARVCATPGDEEEPVAPAAPVVVADTVTETTVTLSWNAVEGAASYNVYMDTVLVKNVTDTVYTVTELTAETTYSFTVTAVADTLESVASNVVTVTTLKVEGIVENTIAFSIYPNPVNDKIYIETEVEVEEVVVYTITGVVAGHQSMVNGQQSTVIDVTSLNSGIYFVKVVTENGEVVKRIVKK